MNHYFRRTATPWVSLSVLAGGLMSAIILFLLVKIERDIERLEARTYLVEERILGN